jgi:hypothetical protein
MAEVTRVGHLIDVKVVQRPRAVEAVVAERRSGVCAGYGIEIVVPAVTLIAPPTGARTACAAVAIRDALVARIVASLTDPDEGAIIRGVILLVGADFRRPEGYRQCGHQPEHGNAEPRYEKSQ